MKHKDGNLVKLEPVELEFLFHCQASRSVIRSIFFPKEMDYFFIRWVKLTETMVKVQRLLVQKKEVMQYNKSLPDKPKALEGRIQQFLFAMKRRNVVIV